MMKINMLKELSSQHVGFLLTYSAALGESLTSKYLWLPL